MARGELAPLPALSAIARRRATGLKLPKLDIQRTRPQLEERFNDGSGSATPASSGTPEALAADFDVGAALDSGTTAVVRLATRRADGRQFAIKCIATRDEEMRNITREEYELMRMLNHSAIVKCDGLYECPSKMSIVMEYCKDGSMEAYVDKHGAFCDHDARPLGSQLLRGVNYLHHKRVVHRDLKPGNLLLHKGATTLKITDFNSATRIGTSAACVMLSERGTKLFSAPELRFGLQWNERIDIWACGLCIYFLLRGVLPFNSLDRNVAETLSKGRLPTVDWSGFSDDMRSLTKQCLTVKMHDRPVAMTLLLHPAFGMASTQKNRRRSSGIFTDSPTPVDGGAPAKPEAAEIFASLQSCGLVSLSAGATKGTWTHEPEPITPPYHRPISCYLFKGTADEEDVPTARCCWKEPLRFDALLRLAANQFSAEREPSL